MLADIGSPAGVMKNQGEVGGVAEARPGAADVVEVLAGLGVEGQGPARRVEEGLPARRVAAR